MLTVLDGAVLDILLQYLWCETQVLVCLLDLGKIFKLDWLNEDTVLFKGVRQIIHGQSVGADAIHGRPELFKFALLDQSPLIPEILFTTVVLHPAEP